MAGLFGEMNMASTERVMAQQLAEFVVGLRYSDLSARVIELAKMAVLDQLGCQLLGSTLEWNKVSYHFVRDLEGKPESTIVHYGTKALAHDAAYVNGTFGQGAELDDYGAGIGAHSGAICIPVALSLGEKGQIDGREFLTAIVTGYEVAWGLGLLMHVGIGHRGFHPQSIIGAFIATAVAGRLLGLNSQQLCNAFGIAGSHASGTMEYDQSGGEVKRLHTGIAVRSGIQSAILAKYGLTGPATIFEGHRGVLRLFAGVENPEGMTLHLGQGIGIMHNCMKQYPTNASQQAPINAMAGLMDKHAFAPEQIEQVEVGLNKGVAMHCGSVYEPSEVIQAQFSLAFSLAIRVIKKSNDLSLYMDPRLWHDPDVLKLARKIRFYAVSEIKDEQKHGCRMRVTITGGQTLEADLEYPKGSFKNPLTNEEIRGKFNSLATRVLPVERCQQVIAMVESLDRVQSVSDVVPLLIK
jgi:2-methylcitrate dehydratase PrpD